MDDCGYFSAVRSAARMVLYGKPVEDTFRNFEEHHMVLVHGIALNEWARDALRRALRERELTLEPWTSLCFDGQKNQTLAFSSVHDAVLARMLLDG